MKRQVSQSGKPPAEERQILELCRNIYSALNIRVFGYGLPYCSIENALDYWPADVIKGSIAAFGSKRNHIIINIEAIKGRGLFSFINIMFHEMVHEYCHLNGIEDVQIIGGEQYHTRGFKDAAEAHGSKPIKERRRLGFHDAELNAAALYRVKDLL